MPDPGVSVGIAGTDPSARGVDKVTRSVRDLVKSLQSLKDLHASIDVGGGQVQARLASATRAAQARVAANPKLAAPKGPDTAAKAQADFAAKFRRDMEAADKSIQRQQNALAAGVTRQSRTKGRLGGGEPDPELSPKDSSLLGKVLGSASSGTAKKEETQVLGKLAEALGWLPGLPGGQNLYMAQMAAGSLGLGAGALAGLTGGVLLGGSALALNQAYTDQLRGGEQLQGAVGSTPGGSGAGSALALSDTMAAQAWLNNLKGDQAAQVASGLAQGGVNTSQGTGPALDAAEKLMSLYGVQGPVAVQLVTQAMEQLGYDADAAKQQMMALAEVARATGTPAASVAAILSGAPNVQALPGGGAELAAADKQVLGTDAVAGKVAGFVSSHNYQSLAGVAALTGLSQQQITQMQGTQAGQAKLQDLFLGGYADYAAKNGAVAAENYLSAATGGQIDLTNNEAASNLIRSKYAGGAQPVQAALAKTQADEAAYRQQQLAALHAPGGPKDLSPQDQFALTGGGTPPKSVTEQIKGALGGIGNIPGILSPDFHPTPEQVAAIQQLPLAGAALDVRQGVDRVSQGIAGGAQNLNNAMTKGGLEGKLEAWLHIDVNNGGQTSYQTIKVPIDSGGQAASQYIGGYHAPGKGQQ